MLWSWEGSSPRGRAGLGSRPGPEGPSSETGLGEPFVPFPPGTCTPCSCPRPRREAHPTGALYHHRQDASHPTEGSSPGQQHAAFLGSGATTHMEPSPVLLAPQLLLVSPRTCSPRKGPLSLGAVQQAGVQLLTLLPKNQCGLCISQQLLVNSRDEWDPQILPWLLPWAGRRSEWPEEEGRRRKE